MLNIQNYITDSRLFKTLKVDDLLFVEFKCIIDETKTGFWTHNNYFVYVLGGKKKFVTTQNEYMVEGGESLFIKRGAYVSHKYFDEEFCALMIFIPDDFIKNIIFKLNSLGISTNDVEESDGILPVYTDEALVSYFHSVLSYFRKSITPPKDLLRIKFEELIINILANNTNRELKAYFGNLCRSAKIRISEIMESNYTRNLNLEEFARLCGRSLSTFKRDFLKVYGIPPGKWLTEKRLHHARMLLETTELGVNEITFQSGFENNSHLVKIFKSAFGLSPLKYRHERIVV